MDPARPLPNPARRYALTRLLVLAAAVALGLLLQGVLTARLEALEELAKRDVLAARATLAAWLRIGGAALFGSTGAVGISIGFSSCRAIGEGRFPPSGIWSFGAARVVEGPQARTFGSIGIALGALLFLASAAAAALTWYMAAVLLACRAL